MIDVTDATFDSEVIQSGQPVVVDFWAPWCGPCKAIAPVLSELDGRNPGVKFVKVDIDDNPEVASRFGILSIPTVIVFSGGAERATVIGAQPKRRYHEALEPHL